MLSHGTFNGQLDDTLCNWEQGCGNKETLSVGTTVTALGIVLITISRECPRVGGDRARH